MFPTIQTPDGVAVVACSHYDQKCPTVVYRADGLVVLGSTTFTRYSAVLSDVEFRIIVENAEGILANPRNFRGDPIGAVIRGWTKDTEVVLLHGSHVRPMVPVYLTKDELMQLGEYGAAALEEAKILSGERVIVSEVEPVPLLA